MNPSSVLASRDRRLLKSSIKAYHRCRARYTPFQLNNFFCRVRWFPNRGVPSDPKSVRAWLFGISLLITQPSHAAARKFSPGAPFIFTSTNKVYGDTPNRLPLRELSKREKRARA